MARNGQRESGFASDRYRRSVTEPEPGRALLSSELLANYILDGMCLAFCVLAVHCSLTMHFMSVLSFNSIDDIFSVCMSSADESKGFRFRGCLSVSHHSTKQHLISILMKGMSKNRFRFVNQMNS